MNDDNYNIIETLKDYVSQYDAYMDLRTLRFNHTAIQQGLPITVDNQALEQIKKIVVEAHDRNRDQHRCYLITNAQKAADAATRVLDMVFKATGTTTDLTKNSNILLAYARGLESRIECLSINPDETAQTKIKILRELIQEIYDAEVRI